MADDPVTGKRDFFSKKKKKTVQHVETQARIKKREKWKKFGFASERQMTEQARTNYNNSWNRTGSLTPEEISLIERFARDQPQEVSDAQLEVLASALRRRKDTIAGVIQQAREKFIRNAEMYVDKHQAAVNGALIHGQFDVAARHAEWAMEHLSHEGVRMIDVLAPEKSGPSGPQIVVGVNVGGLPKPE